MIEWIHIGFLIFLYIVFFIIFTFLKTISKTLDKWIFCSVCFTWASVLTVFAIGYFIFHGAFPLYILTFLFGMSIAGMAGDLNEIMERKTGKSSQTVKFITSKFFIYLLFTIVSLIIIGLII